MEVIDAVQDDLDEAVDVEKDRDGRLDDNVLDEGLNEVEWTLRIDDVDEVAVLK